MKGFALARGRFIRYAVWKRPRAEEKVDDVAFVRLEPVELDGRNRTEIEAVDMHRVNELATETGHRA